MKLHYGDMTDSSSLVKVISSVQPTEIYNLAAQSHVMVGIMSITSHPDRLEFMYFIYT